MDTLVSGGKRTDGRTEGKSASEQGETRGIRGVGGDKRGEERSEEAGGGGGRRRGAIKRRREGKKDSSDQRSGRHRVVTTRRELLPPSALPRPPPPPPPPPPPLEQLACPLFLRLNSSNFRGQKKRASFRNRASSLGIMERGQGEPPSSRREGDEKRKE